MIRLLLLLLPSIAFAQASYMEVVNVTPNYRTVTRYQTVVETMEVCYRVNEFNGMLERIVDGSFGSTEGLVGTVAGAAIGDVIGGGGDNTTVKVIGGVIGNKIGNNIADKRNNTCKYEDITRKEPYNVQEMVSYHVVVKSDNSQYTVVRPYSPTIGERIKVSVTGQ